MTEEEIASVIEGWKGVYMDEGEMLRRLNDGKGDGGYVQIFEVSFAVHGRGSVRWMGEGDLSKMHGDGREHVLMCRIVDQ